MATHSTGERIYGALLGLAYGDALGFPAMFHRSYQFPIKRREFIWRTNRDLMRQRIVRLTLPFTHRLPAEILGMQRFVERTHGYGIRYMAEDITDAQRFLVMALGYSSVLV